MTDDSLNRMVVLIVDDDTEMQLSVKGMLRGFGVRSIKTAHDGTSALSLMQSTRIDLVVCETKMRPMGGLEFVRTVRDGHLDIDRLTPIILLTAHSELTRVTEAGIVGVDEFVTKPVSADRLFKRMRSVAVKPQSSLVAARLRTVTRVGNSDLADGDTRKRAQATVAKFSDAYVEGATRDIEELNEAYGNALASPTERGRRIGKIAAVARQVEGQGDSFGYPLMSAIGKSLANFSRTIKRCDESHLELIKTHIDAMTVVINSRLEGGGGARGAELVRLLGNAIEKNQG